MATTSPPPLPPPPIDFFDAAKPWFEQHLDKLKESEKNLPECEKCVTQHEALDNIKIFFSSPGQSSVCVVMPSEADRCTVALLAPFVIGGAKALIITTSKTRSQQIYRDCLGTTAKPCIYRRIGVPASAKYCGIQPSACIQPITGIAELHTCNIVIVNAQKFGRRGNRDVNNKDMLNLDLIQAGVFKVIIIDDADHYPISSWRVLADFVSGNNGQKCIFLAGTVPKGKNLPPTIFGLVEPAVPQHTNIQSRTTESSPIEIDDDDDDDDDTVILRGSYLSNTPATAASSPLLAKATTTKIAASTPNPHPSKVSSAKKQTLSMRNRESTYTLAAQSTLDMVATPAAVGWQTAHASPMHEELPKAMRPLMAYPDTLPTWGNVDENTVKRVCESHASALTPSAGTISRMFAGQIGLFIDVGVTCTGVTVLWQRNAIEACPSCIVFHDNIDLTEDVTEEQLCARYNLEFLPEGYTRWDQINSEADVWAEDVQLYEDMTRHVQIVAPALMRARLDSKSKVGATTKNVGTTTALQNDVDTDLNDDHMRDLDNTADAQIISRMGGVLPVQTKHVMQKCAAAAAFDLGKFSDTSRTPLPKTLVTRGVAIFASISRWARFLKRCFGEMDMVAIEAQPATFGIGGVTEQLHFVNAIAAENPNARILPSVSASRKLRVNQLDLATLSQLKNDRTVRSSVRRHSLIGPSGTLVSMSSSKDALAEISTAKGRNMAEVPTEVSSVDNTTKVVAKRTRAVGTKRSRTAPAKIPNTKQLEPVVAPIIDEDEQKIQGSSAPSPGVDNVIDDAPDVDNVNGCDIGDINTAQSNTDRGVKWNNVFAKSLPNNAPCDDITDVATTSTGLDSLHSPVSPMEEFGTPVDENDMFDADIVRDEAVGDAKQKEDDVEAEAENDSAIVGKNVYDEVAYAEATSDDFDMAIPVELVEDDALEKHRRDVAHDVSRITYRRTASLASSQKVDSALNMLRAGEMEAQAKEEEIDHVRIGERAGFDDVEVATQAEAEDEDDDDVLSPIAFLSKKRSRSPNAQDGPDGDLEGTKRSLHLDSPTTRTNDVPLEIVDCDMEMPSWETATPAATMLNAPSEQPLATSPTTSIPPSIPPLTPPTSIGNISKPKPTPAPKSTSFGGTTHGPNPAPSVGLFQMAKSLMFRSTMHSSTLPKRPPSTIPKRTSFGNTEHSTYPKPPVSKSATIFPRPLPGPGQ